MKADPIGAYEIRDAHGFWNALELVSGVILERSMAHRTPDALRDLSIGMDEFISLHPELKDHLLGMVAAADLVRALSRRENGDPRRLDDLRYERSTVMPEFGWGRAQAGAPWTVWEAKRMRDAASIIAGTGGLDEYVFDPELEPGARQAIWDYAVAMEGRGWGFELLAEELTREAVDRPPRDFIEVAAALDHWPGEVGRLRAACLGERDRRYRPRIG